MKIKSGTIIRLISIGVIFLYVSYFPINNYTNKFDAVITLLLSVILVVKSKDNPPLVIMFFFMFYINYSFIVGDYLIGTNIFQTFTQVRNVEIYGVTIRVILLFMYIITLMYKPKKFNFLFHKLEPRDNYIAFYLSIFLLVYMLIFGLDRTVRDTYSVRISPLFEYSKVLFLFAYYFSGKSSIRKIILTSLLIVFIAQDVYYGGRVTTLQLLIFSSITFWVSKLTFKRIITFSLMGILFNSLVGSYRINYSLQDISFLGIISNLIDNYFAFSTAVHAYYSSATHVAASAIASMDLRITSFFEFFQSIFIGSRSSIEGNVTNLVSQEFYRNIGGGILPTFFYFWFGWIGVLIISFILVGLLNGLRYENSIYQKILFLGIIINAPRWYLYSPNQLFRGTLLFISILWILFGIVKTITSRSKININNN